MSDSIVARLRAILTAETGDFKSDMAAAGKSVKDFSKESGEAQKAGANFGKMFSSLSKGIAGGTAAIATIGVTMKKAFDLGEAGAQVLQTTESFDLLLEKVGAAPDLLDELKRASNYTIDEMSLMSSTATLLAGTTGEFATQLANATPELMEIAKAANKLNPALGTTADMYDSIATGIKRGSPMILDNLGLTIKVGEANQKYAEQLGVTVDQLSAEQKQMALLNDVMRAGDELINQVGGSTVSATDNIARMQSSMTNAGNAIKEKFAQPIAQAADAVFLLLEGQNLIQEAYDDHNDQVAETANTYKEYTAEMVRAAVAAGKIREDLADVLVQTYLSGDATNYLMDAYGLLDRETVQLQFDTNLLGTDMETTRDKVDILTRSQWELEHGVRASAQQMRLHSSLLGTTGEATEEYTETVEEAEGAQDGLNSSLGETKSKLDGINTSIGSTIERYKEQIAFFSAGGADLVKFTDDLMEAWERGVISSDEAQGYLTDAGIAAVDLDLELGKIDPEEAVERLMDLGLGPEEAKAKVGELQASLYRLTSQEYFIDIYTRYHEGGGASFSRTAPGGGGSVGTTKSTGSPKLPTAGGGDRYAGQEMLVGEFGPEYFMAPADGTVVPNNRLGSLGGDRTVNIISGDTILNNTDTALIRESYVGAQNLAVIRQNMG